MAKEKSKAELLKEQLFMEKKHAGLIMSELEIVACDDFCESYKIGRASCRERVSA